MIKNMFRSPLGAVVAAVGLGVLGILFGVQAMGAYGLGVFILLPFAMGFVAGSLYDAPSTGRAVLVGLVPPIVVAAILLLVALEGALCIAMAAPLALPLSALGAAAAHWQRRDARAVGALALSVPLFMGFEAGADRQPEVHPIRTSVVVEAPPSVVWRHVLSFPPLPAPREAVFRAGIAYPVGATIEGRGVGAIRRCRFSTGDFVEPITAWEPPRRLAFDVSAQPAPMRELSPWGDVHAPHLDGFLRSHRGEFRLTPLPGGRTLLEGTTWYENRMWPQAYWRLWSDDLIHAIHRRVLRHVAAQAEADPRA